MMQKEKKKAITSQPALDQNAFKKPSAIWPIWFYVADQFYEKRKRQGIVFLFQEIFFFRHTPSFFNI